MSKLTKKDFKNGTKFMTKFSDDKVYTLGVTNNQSKYIESVVLLSSKKLAVKDNFYSLESITDKYLKMWDINFGQKQIFKVKLSDIEIVDIDYKTL